MTVQGLRFVLLLFALAGYAGAGAALAVSRARVVEVGEHDAGLMGIAAMLFTFGALCTLAASGAWGVLAFGLVTTAASYLITAQRIGLFRIEARRRSNPPAETETGEEAHREH